MNITGWAAECPPIPFMISAFEAPQSRGGLPRSLRSGAEREDREMIILGIESAALTASVAVVTDDLLTAEYTVNHKITHSQTLLPMLDEIVRMLTGEDHEGAVMKAQEYFSFCREHDTQYAYIEHMRSFYQILRSISMRSRRGGEYLTLSPGYAGTTDLERALLNCIEMFFEEKEREALLQYSEHVLRAQQFIRKEYIRDISVSDIAESVGISEGHLRRLFKQEMNM